MSKAIQQLTHLISSLKRGGDDLRLYAAESVFKFKHSWIETADALVQVRDMGAYRRWGYDNFLTYCEGELGLKRALVDKLTVSYSALREYVPDRLTGEDDAPIPSYQALDYYSRAVGAPRFDGSDPVDSPSEPLSPELSGQLYAAVFEECSTHKQLKERFEPLLRPKSTAEEEREAVQKVLSTAKRLHEQLEEVGALKPDLLRNAAAILTELQTALIRRKELLEEYIDRNASEVGTEE